MRRWGLLAALAVLASCRVVPEGEHPAAPAPPPQPTVTSAALAGIAPGPSIRSLGMSPVDAAAALASFRESCPKLLARADLSGLSYAQEWRPACSAAAKWPAGRGAAFFEEFFETARVGDGVAFATGYYEPEILGSRTRIPGYEVPIYRPPPELVRGWWDETPEAQRSGRQQLGRYDAEGRFVPYYERAEIDAGAIANRGLEIAWAADPIELFFLQIQGSGRLRTPNGEIIRIGYAGQNGREYVGIGRVLRERGLIGPGTPYETSMQGIMAYLRAQPDGGASVMNENKSWIFFTELTGDGPLGALGVPVRRESSVAADPNFVPLGAPVWLQMDRPDASGMWIAQDTGGAIKGANRFDTFWGAGGDARAIAGGMSARGRALVLLPKESIVRLTAR